jgi:hypothetical protein
MLNIKEIKNEYYNTISADIRKCRFELKQATVKSESNGVSMIKVSEEEVGDEEVSDEEVSGEEVSGEEVSDVLVLENKLTGLLNIKNQLDSGMIVPEIYKIKEMREKGIQQKIHISNRVKEKKMENKKYDKKMLDTFYKDQKNIRYNDNKLKYFIKNKTKKYIEILDTIPNFMTKNLDGMPSSKGYIWRGVYMNGKVDSNDSTTTYREKYKGENYTHVYNSDRYQLYKHSHTRRHTVKDISRNNILNGNKVSLSDFVKLDG